MDFWQKARSFAEDAAKKSQELTKEAAKRSQEFTKEAAKRSQDFTIGSSKLSDIVSEASKRSKEIAAEASKKADLIKVEALKVEIKIASRSVIPVPFPPPAGDYNVLAGDWFKQNHTDLKAILDNGHDLPFPDGLLINGRGSNAFTFNVEQGL
ncbi:putative multicopper oxidase, type 1, cupredoxin [Helianthus annuus]|nr:putative multicopper oxidase, type 1, cupredoxin [Helianthus annuus]